MISAVKIIINIIPLADLLSEVFLINTDKLPLKKQSVIGDMKRKINKIKYDLSPLKYDH